MSIIVNPPVQARFTHENGTALRMQAFLLVRDAKRHVLAARLDGFEGWMLPGEGLLLNEDPHDAAKRIAKTWFESPLPTPKLVDVFSYPATGGDDDRWYVLFIFETTVADAPKGTPDTKELKFLAPGSSAGPWALSHAEVWERIR